MDTVWRPETEAGDQRHGLPTRDTAWRRAALTIATGSTHHGHPGVDEAEGHEGVAADRHQHGRHHPEDVAAGEVDREADDGRRHQGDDVDDARARVGVGRRHLKLADKKHPADMEQDPAESTAKRCYKGLQQRHATAQWGLFLERIAKTLERKVGLSTDR